MTISYHWLKEYIPLSESPEEVAQILTSTGLEVETLETLESIKGSLEGVVIGEVITCSKHPNADKLSITTVDIGTGTPVPIVCGAANIAQGQKVLVATVGAELFPVHGKPFLIKKAKIRGEVSEGMICAEDELGLGTNHDGIVVLSTDLPTGTPAAQLYNIYTDYIFEIGLTPNRADAASHLGVARDLRAYTGRNITWPAVDAYAPDDISHQIHVTVEDEIGCPRYSAVTIHDITVADSPVWLKNRLKAIGLAPINNIVDITNFVCHEMGQPLHAFDADKISGGRVIVKTLPGGTSFISLDGKERTLTENDLMICDNNKGLCMAGVFGGKHSGVSETTKAIFLESAYFSSSYIRKTSTHHQLKTDASFRFERGTDPNLTVYALKRAALLIKEIAGGKVSSDLIDLYPKKIENRIILIKDKNITRLIGKIIPREEIITILKNLDIDILDQKADSFSVSVPPYRVDVVQEADIVEEIIRIYGYDRIELKPHLGSDYLAEFPQKDSHQFRRIIDETLTSNGFFEIWTNSLTNSVYQEKHKLHFQGQSIEILNKLSEEQGILRQTMLFSGLEVCAYNINRKQKDLKLYEFGKIYSLDGEKYEEEPRLALFMTGNLEAENWQRPSTGITYHDLAQQVYHILIKSGIKKPKQELLQDQLFEYGVTLFHTKEVIGRLGSVKKALLKDFGIKQDLFYAELSTSLLFRAANPKLAIEDVPKFPEVRRDLSLVIDKEITFEKIQEIVRSTEKRLIKDIVVFDVYEGDKVPHDKKAYAMAFTLLDEQKTLTDQEIDKTMDRLMAAFEEKLGAVIRK